jgi:hypothetical protein
MKDLGMDEWMVEVLMELYGFQKAGYASMVSPSNTKYARIKHY